MGASNVQSSVVIQDTVEGPIHMTPFAKAVTTASGTVETGLSAITGAIFQLTAPGVDAGDAFTTGCTASGAHIKFHSLQDDGTLPTLQLGGTVFAFGTKIQGQLGIGS